MNFLQEFEEIKDLVKAESDNFELGYFKVQMDELIESLQSVSKDNQEQVIPAIFRFFEKYPLNVMGLPGTFTHFIESFWPNYSDILLD